MSGRYVTVVLPREELLILCEVKINGTKRGTINVLIHKVNCLFSAVNTYINRLTAAEELRFYWNISWGWCHYQRRSLFLPGDSVHLLDSLADDYTQFAHVHLLGFISPEIDFFFHRFTLCAGQREQDVGRCSVLLQGQTQGPGFHPRPRDPGLGWAGGQGGPDWLGVVGPSLHLHPGVLVLGRGSSLRFQSLGRWNNRVWQECCHGEKWGPSLVQHVRLWQV